MSLISHNLLQVCVFLCAYVHVSASVLVCACLSGGTVCNLCVCVCVCCDFI